MRNQDLELRIRVHHPFVDQRRHGVGFLERLADRDHQPVAPHARVGMAGRMNEDHRAQLCRLGPERPQPGIAELDPVHLRGDDDAADYHGTAIGHRHLGFRRLGI